MPAAQRTRPGRRVDPAHRALVADTAAGHLVRWRRTGCPAVFEDPDDAVEHTLLPPAAR